MYLATNIWIVNTQYSVVKTQLYNETAAFILNASLKSKRIQI